MNTVDVMPTTGPNIAVQAARNYRILRAKGLTVRKTIDTLIATRCILDGHELLHSDRDFDPFVEHLGLRVVGA
jgi:predicted nucleic acid-binding protein